jgi:hypothetical protein
MKIHTPLLLLTTVASALAFIVPCGEPTATFVGRVVSTGKVGDVFLIHSQIHVVVVRILFKNVLFA